MITTRPTAPASTDTTAATGITAGDTMEGTIRRRRIQIKFFWGNSRTKNMDDNKKRIAKNTLFLYLRTLISTLVGLYTSRVVLNTLGVEDYGVFGLVGGCVAMFTFLNSSMAGATSRFLTFELGRGNFERLRNTFSSAIMVHIFLGVVIALLSETIGMWFLVNKLVIPEGRMFAAQMILHTSVAGMLISMCIVPLGGCIVAHEHFQFYAYIELLNSFLKLGIVYLLTLVPFDKLVFYTFLQLGVTVLIAAINIFYCLRHFPETHFRFVYDRPVLKSLLSFSGWDLFGNMSVTMRDQGMNFIINMFFGVVFNAAASVAITVQGAIMGLSSNIKAAFRPQIIKQFSVGDYTGTVSLLYSSAKLSSLLLAIISVPAFFEMDTIMVWWLKNPPQYASLFCRILLIAAYFSNVMHNLDIGIHATGRMRRMSIFTGFCFLAHLPLLWVSYRMGLPVETNYYIMIVIYWFASGIKASLLRQYIPSFSICKLFSKVYIPVFAVIVITSACLLCLSHLVENQILHFLMVFGVAVAVGCLSSAYIALNAEQRRMVYSYLGQHFLRNKH